MVFIKRAQETHNRKLIIHDSILYFIYDEYLETRCSHELYEIEFE